jgi:Hypothetical protein (DUF2513)
MKRDVDLIRQILFDLERHGPDCSLESLRNGTSHEIDERTRYHLRLCIDAGLAKEIDRSAAGSPCVRLTNAGHELLDICRGDDRWQAAKWIVHQQTGGLSLAVLRAVLTKWAVQGMSRSERHRRWRRPYRPYYVQEYYPGEVASAAGPYRVDSYRYEREPFYDDEHPPLVRARRDYRELHTPTEHWEPMPHPADDAIADEPLGVSLPINII